MRRHKSTQSKHTSRHRLAPRPNCTPAPNARRFQPAPSSPARSAAPTILRARVASQHEHGLAALLVELLEEQERLLLQAEAALLVAVHDVQGVLAPVVVDVVAFKGLREAGVLARVLKV